MDGWLARCAPFLAGGGRIEATPGGVRLILPAASSARYADTQLDDYAGLPRRRFPHRPPLRLSLRARFSHGVMTNHGDTEDTEGFNTAEMVEEPALRPKGVSKGLPTGAAGLSLRGSLLGTAGFGFWNNPFGAQSKLPAPPQAVWFFYASPPSDMPLALGVPGHGWKAACLDAGRASALVWAPLAPMVMLACRAPKLYRAVWPRVQRALDICESPLAFKQGDMTGWHVYELDWRRDGARWRVDGETMLEIERAPRGPLGFVAWIDNQYAVVTPQGKFRFGLLDAPFEQWLELADVQIATTDH